VYTANIAQEHGANLLGAKNKDGVNPSDGDLELLIFRLHCISKVPDQLARVIHLCSSGFITLGPSCPLESRSGSVTAVLAAPTRYLIEMEMEVNDGIMEEFFKRHEFAEIGVPFGRIIHSTLPLFVFDRSDLPYQQNIDAVI
jgi:hypothetical protein